MDIEIKFRAWDKDNKKFIDNPENWQIRDLNDDRDFIWQQYTGLKDKNEKEIYQGDIVKIYNYEETWKRGEPTFDWRVFQVIRNKYVWAFENSVIYLPMSSYDIKTLKDYEIEVIGNINENPKLFNPIKVIKNGKTKTKKITNQ